MSIAAELAPVAALERLWQEYRGRFKACRRQWTEADIHDLRVSARRMLGVLDIVRSLDPHTRPQQTRRLLKRLLANLDKVRDVQVMLLKMAEVPEHLAILGPFRAQLERREKRLLRRAERKIRDSRPSKVRKGVDKAHLALWKAKAQEGFPAPLLTAVDSLYQKASARSAQIDAGRPASIHAARLAFKRFRYAVEIVAPLLPTFPPQQPKRMHDYQRMMGDVRDLEILRGALTEFAANLPFPGEADPAAIDLSAICRSYEACQAQLTSTLLQERDVLSTFWRSAPERPFPWESNDDPLHHPSRDRGADEPCRRIAGRQPAAPDPKRPQEDEADRTRLEPSEGAH